MALLAAAALPSPTEDVLALCAAMGVATGIDPDRYGDVVDLVTRTTGRPSIAHVVRGGTREQMAHVDWDEIL